MKHVPTVEASIQYWEAVRVRAIRAGDLALEITAFGLRSSYEQAHQELTNHQRMPKKSALPHVAPDRQPPKPSRGDMTKS
jgi:hypothetical protein